MERDDGILLAGNKRAYFNSRAHVKRDVFVLNIDEINSISTHALTWSATGERVRTQFLREISTHALTWSATEVKCSPLC